ncbi:nuclear transport factor 2 family protein [Agriterribacter humi]|uniref:nuclear transport factor 2 family protein n=1 Tax=Agriterribacter humi TaxID=1104781 RepID=UPI0012642CF9|nr:nuclear transport factor 2 family protein [Agriterribacter humi]
MPTVDNLIEKQLMAIERKLWTNDPVLYKNNLLKGALLVFGETGVITRDFAVDAIKTENAENRKWAEVEFGAIHCVKLTEDVALLTYTVSSRWNYESTAVTALASSAYVKHGPDWKLAFHQQTPIPVHQKNNS